MEKSYFPVFELLWYAQMPCVDVKDITSERQDEMSFIKRCFWKDEPISCNAIFQKRPTDRGMCCSFNMEKADTILKNSKYTNYGLNNLISCYLHKSTFHLLFKVK